MGIDVEMIQGNDYLEFVVTGSHDMNEAIDKFTHMLDVCRNTGLTKVLIDYRKLDYQVEATGKGLYAFRIEDLYIKYLNSGGKKLQIAFLAPALHTFEPGADIGRKVKSLQFELFEDLNEAREWLGVKTT